MRDEISQIADSDVQFADHGSTDQSEACKGTELSWAECGPHCVGLAARKLVVILAAWRDRLCGCTLIWLCYTTPLSRSSADVVDHRNVMSFSFESFPCFELLVLRAPMLWTPRGKTGWERQHLAPDPAEAVFSFRFEAVSRLISFYKTHFWTWTN